MDEGNFPASAGSLLESGVMGGTVEGWLGRRSRHARPV